LFDGDAGEIFGQGGMGVRLAHEEEVAARGAHVLADRLAGIEVIAQVDGVEMGIGCGMVAQPAPAGPALAVLLLATILRCHEGRRQRDGAVVACGFRRKRTVIPIESGQ
jgi:hypothetical protein